MPRIIAGSHKGRRLLAPGGGATRPTSDRVREAAFGVIASEFGYSGDPAAMLLGRAFLDLYAGSGAVALEAASRGADPVLAVEHDRRAVEVIRRNARQAGLAVRVLPVSVERFLAGEPVEYDVCWLDPPYGVGSAVVSDVLRRLGEGWLAPGGLVIVERSARAEPLEWPDGLGDRWERRYGETTLYFATEGGR